MPFATLNGKPVIEANLHFPRAGLWTFEAQVDTADPDALTGQVVFRSKGLTLSGTVLRGGTAFDVGGVSVVLGKGGMPTLATPRAYRFATYGLVVNDLLKQAGEALASDADPGILNAPLAAWTVLTLPVGVALTRLLQDTGALWRSRPDGSIWIGTDSFLPLERADLNLSDNRPAHGEVIVQPETVDVFPGVSFRGIDVEYVTHHVGPEGTFSRLQAA